MEIFETELEPISKSGDLANLFEHSRYRLPRINRAIPESFAANPRVRLSQSAYWRQHRS
jgi:hypothetical protein